jgi:hypothetical protein
MEFGSTYALQHLKFTSGIEILKFGVGESLTCVEEVLIRKLGGRQGGGSGEEEDNEGRRELHFV